jgi:predicted MPP superfamily phosphohydrolase
MDKQVLFEEAGKIFEQEPRLIQLPSQGKVVFVGDTHGDSDATRRVVDRYLKKDYQIVFLGDYVDRGQQSEENIHYLLQTKLRHPDRVFLLAGNHEGYMVKQFHPANFWSTLSREKQDAYGLLFSRFPLGATSENGILALHGGLPELSSLEEINQTEWGDDHWDKIVWGDFVEVEAEVLGEWGGRPQFGWLYFNRMMRRYNKNVLVRSHQPQASQVMFDRRCITIFTSNAYLPIRTIVVADLEKEIRTADDVRIERI